MALVDRCIFIAASAGTGSFVVAGAAQGYMTPAQAQAVNATSYSYAAELRDANNNILAWEVGSGTYTSATTTLTRTPLFSSNANGLVNFAAAPNVTLTLLATDIPFPLSPITNLLASNVALTNTAAYFQGPTIAQGTVGTWFVMGSVEVQGNVGDAINLKMWDGTTVIASSALDITSGSGGVVYASFAGLLVNPTGSLQIAVQNATSTTGSNILANAAGAGANSSNITAIRVG